MAGKSVAEWLQRSQETAPLVQQAVRYMNLQRLLAQLVPASVAPMCHVAAFRDGTLHIAANNGAIAAKLKLLTSCLLTQIREMAPEVNRIQVGVQGSLPEPSPVTRKGARLPRKALPAIDELAGQVADAPLREALERMAARHRGGGGKDDA